MFWKPSRTNPKFGQLDFLFWYTTKTTEAKQNTGSMEISRGHLQGRKTALSVHMQDHASHSDGSRLEAYSQLYTQNANTSE